MNRPSWQAGLVFLLILVIGTAGTGWAQMASQSPARAPSPWDFYLEEALAGSLGAAAGGFGGAFLLVTLFCRDQTGLEGLGCALSSIFMGGIGGGALGATLGVSLDGWFLHHVQGNLLLAPLGGALGLVGSVLFVTNLQFPPGFGLALTALGTGLGAALGYNVGAQILAPQEPNSAQS